MGSCLWRSENLTKILMLGTVNSGKTTLLNRLKHGKYVYSPIDKSEFFISNKEEIFSVDIKQQVKGMLISRFYPHTKEIILIADSSNRKQLEESIDSIKEYIMNEDNALLPLLILNNIKGQQLELTSADIVLLLNIDCNKRKIKIFNCSCLTLENIEDGFQWLRNNINMRTLIKKTN